MDFYHRIMCRQTELQNELQAGAQAERRAQPSPGDAVAIRFCAVTKRYRGRSVLRNVSFAVPARSSTAIVGLNGVGKSTLLRCLLDFTRPDEGTISIAGRDHGDIGARAALAWLPERFVPPAHLTARESLCWLAGLRGIALDPDHVEATADSLGLARSALDRRVAEFSKGMTQKLGLISISLSQCPIWVLDEPMSGLDPQARRDVTRLLDTARRCGRTLLFTSHGLRDLPALCDRVVVLNDGEVAFTGTPAELGARYRESGRDAVTNWGAPGGPAGAEPSATDLEAAFLACIGEQGTKGVAMPLGGGTGAQA